MYFKENSAKYSISFSLFLTPTLTHLGHRVQYISMQSQKVRVANVLGL